jgi:diketogulonate reductase-like aldo/keto reductase
MRTVTFPDATKVPALGQGTWRMGENARTRKAEADALRLGIELGMTLIDTAEMYGEGGSEEVVALATAGLREKVFLVSKVYPHNASRTGTIAAADRSLKRLNTDRIDLYLLHWRGGAAIDDFIEAAERLRASGKIIRWGVSNFDVDDMQDVAALPAGTHCATNQVLYNLESRGIEFDLIPWCAEQDMPVMAYSPVGQGGRLLNHKALGAVAKRHGTTPAVVALAWVLRHPGMIAIPKAATQDHVRANVAALSLALDAEDFTTLDRAFAPPARKQALGMI